ncbi:MAG: glycosyltransferase family 1 protein [Candidatus Daviesbacteria bacterium]|nr:glycosyltransferase family 1 protein [Candidatus Daviesbacteria bacterium]
MRIWIDGYEANVPQRLGSSQVAFEILKNLESIDQKNEYTIVLPQKPMDDLPKERKDWKYKILKPNKLWTRIALPLALYTAKIKPDLIFSPTHYIPRFSPVKRVVTIFDLAYLHYPQMYKKDDFWKLNNWSKFSIENADKIITISNFCKQDIIKEYKINKDKIILAYPGYDAEIFHKIQDKNEVQKIVEKYQIQGKYIIYIGTIQPKKNLVRLIEAFGDIDDLKLVIVGKTTGLGKQGWKFEEILKRPKELGIEEKVIFTGFVPTEDLPYLLSGAEAFVLPSLYEGFGIPVVEAMACGIPVIVSNVASLPEVAGKAGLFIDPLSVDQITQAIRTISSDKKLRLQKSKECLVQAKKFSWKNMAKIVLKTFEEVTK